MLRVGLSGGIGSGKSTVAGRFRELGAVVIDADQLAREVVAPGSEGLAAIVERFGDVVLEEDGSLNRAALGAVVFADPQARRDLEQLTHPRIAARTAALVEAAPADAVVVHDVPLLVEKHLGPGYHLVVVVGADERTRLRRLMETRGMTEDDVRSRMAAQATDGQRRAAADVWLDNGGTKEALVAAVDSLWHERLVPFERNVRHGIRATRSDDLVLHPHDSAWAFEAQRLLERLRLAFGEVAVTADHVGSTAIPGLVAKDVIDLQVGVADLRAADDPALLERLSGAGFPRPADAPRADNAKADGQWPKRFHAGADPGRQVHVHVREAGSPGWRWALLFRDWLRADDVACREYAAEKARLAATGMGVGDYADAKEPWFDGVHERVEAWARQTGWEPRHGWEPEHG
ncbi:dephospho-CoA kinase [Pedococcus cremeus]|uniref:Dephospho-CoA kinase n=1 Tax=Pedococcus cremeus TaxID=587636 RepID=A0A1H9X0V9_9MICO|nr:dephospho-CoA kinase [Pedococcus cremeus]SES39735.1 dephospho-CoA kinase [Pedococcus cremeus]